MTRVVSTGCPTPAFKGINVTMLLPSLLENLRRQYPPVSGEGKRGGVEVQEVVIGSVNLWWLLALIYRIDVLQYILIPIINSVTSINLRKDGMTSPAKYCYEKAIHVQCYDQLPFSCLWTSRFFILNILLREQTFFPTVLKISFYS